MVSSISIVKTSVDSSRVAKLIAKTLVKEHLCACGQVVPRVTSFYFFNDKLQSAREYWVILKTATASTSRLIARLEELHPYEVPEIMVWEADSRNPGYTAWLEQNTTTREES